LLQIPINEDVSMKRIVCAAVVAAALLAPATVAAQTEMEIPPEFMEVIQKDAATLRMDVMQSTIQLQTGEAAGFWSIYEEFLGELNPLVAVRAELLRDYAAQYAELTNEQVVELGNRAIQLEMDRMDIIARYFERIAGEVSGVTAGQFYQIEQQTDMLIDLRLAMEVPIIGRQ
jgi:hypothetical protein